MPLVSLVVAVVVAAFAAFAAAGPLPRQIRLLTHNPGLSRVLGSDARPGGHGIEETRVILKPPFPARIDKTGTSRNRELSNCPLGV